MKFVASLIVTLMLAVVPLSAQSKFQLSGKALGYVGGGTGLIAADAVSETKVSPQFSLRTDSIFISAAADQANLASFNLAGVSVPIPAEKLFKKFGLDATKYSVYGLAEGGTVTSAAGTTRAFSAGAGVTRALSDAVTLNVFEARWLNGPVPVGNLAGGGVKYANNGFAISVGVTIK